MKNQINLVLEKLISSDRVLSDAASEPQEQNTKDFIS